jgi:hypothetical protein
VTVHHRDDRRFRLGGCLSDGLIAHYISPRKMVCMWRRVQAGAPEWCC